MYSLLQKKFDQKKYDCKQNKREGTGEVILHVIQFTVLVYAWKNNISVSRFLKA